MRQLRQCAFLNSLLLLLCFDIGIFSFLPNNVRDVRTTILSKTGHERLKRIPIFLYIPSVNEESENDYFFEDEDNYSEEQIKALTVPQLKQQLRLRGLKVSGRKQELVARLAAAACKPSERSKKAEGQSPKTEVQEENFAKKINSELEELNLEYNVVEGESTIEPEVVPTEKKSKARQFAEDRGKKLIDVTAYLDEDDTDKHVKSSTDLNKDEKYEGDEEISQEKNAEVWGSKARIVDDYEGRSLVIDNLSRCVVEFRGSNHTMCTAFAVASRDALQNFLSAEGYNTNMTAPEQRLREIQVKRELAVKRRPKDLNDAADEGDEEGIYKNVLHRDLTDWGKYTVTGEQLSAAEVQGVLLLSDDYGPFSNHTRALAEKIAFECQPVVVLVPDIFRGYPWKEVEQSGLDERGNTYEEWQAEHNDLRASVDIRAAAACLRQSYGVSSICLWGTSNGGGRVLEAASGVNPKDSVHDIDGSVGPPPVDPMTCIAWYPTRYDVKKLFGVNYKGRIPDENRGEGMSKTSEMAVMAVFAGEDDSDGATLEDAASLKECLSKDKRVKDYMVKVFPGQTHGFAHMNLGRDPEERFSEEERFVDEEFGGSGKVGIDEGEAEVACLLSTAWMETYGRVFLPTVGPTVSKDRDEEKWQELEMGDLSEANTRDIREEIDAALKDFKGIPDAAKKFDRFDEDYHDEIKKVLKSYQSGYDAGKNTILEDDSVDIAYTKIRADGHDLW